MVEWWLGAVQLLRRGRSTQPAATKQKVLGGSMGRRRELSISKVFRSGSNCEALRFDWRLAEARRLPFTKTSIMI